MKNIGNKIKSLSLEQINKNLLLLAFVLLLFRIGNFYNTFIPKPFEAVLVSIIFFTFVDLIINNKLKDFFLSINKKIWIALSCLVFSVFVGWFVAIFVKKIPVNLNVILEFGNFTISVIIFILVLFYTRNDKNYIKIYFYALLLPAVYGIFIFLPKVAYYLNLGNEGTFLGLTMNPNVISKILLIPAMFFLAHSLFKSEQKWIRWGHIVLAVVTVSLLFWVASRGSLVALVLASLLAWLVFSLHHFNWKKLFYSGAIIFMIFLIGFFITPGAGKQRVILKALYPYGLDKSSDYLAIKDKPVGDIVTKFINTSDKHFLFYIERETRFQIWPFYFKYAIVNPLGIGPNTHFSFGLKDYASEYINPGPHNTFLQIWFWGGLLGIISFLYIFINAFKNLFVNLRPNFNPMGLALLSILFALSVAIMFDDSLSCFWFFIILALALRYENTRS